MAERTERLDPRTRKPLPEGIRYRADRGKYQVRVWATGLNGEDRERSFLVGSLAEAKRVRSEAQTRIKPDGGMTLDVWHSRYWPTIESSIRPATARGYDVAWRRRVQPWFGHRKLETISAGDVDEAIGQWSGSASTRNDALAMLSRLLDGAVRFGVIGGNPARLVRRPREDGARSFRSRALSSDEVRTLLAAVEDGPYRAYLSALVFTGMRAGEASALRVSDVDLAGRVIHVRRSFSPGRNGELIEQSPKSHKERTVPLPGTLLPSITEQVEGKRRNDLVFTGPKGDACRCRTSVGPSTGRTFDESWTGQICASTISDTLSQRSCSMPGALPTTCRPSWDTLRCRSRSATVVHVPTPQCEQPAHLTSCF